MQLGTLGGPLVVAVVVLVWRRSVGLAAAVAVAGVLAWFAAKGVKAIVERGRPLEYVADIAVREGSGAGLGFVSGHTAVAFACAAVLAPELPRSWRVVVFVVAALIGIARIVHGVHLPADVLGGAGLGLLCGLGARLGVEAVTTPAADPAAG
jgi:undecaprenyl-diphosphatase